MKTQSISLASESKLNYKLITTPFATLNNLIGGIPRGRFTTIAGPQQTGKGTLILQTIAYNQRIDPEFVALYSDAENGFEEEWATHLGVDLDRLILQKYTTEVPNMETLLTQALETIKLSKSIDMWVIDSVGGLAPKREMDRELDQENMMVLPKKLGEFFRKANMSISPVEGYDGCAVVLIGQVYDVPTTTGVTLTEVRGGNALKHWAHLRLNTKRGPRDEAPEEINIMCSDGKARKLRPGWAGRIKLDKTRINSKEGQEILLPFYFGRGFDNKESTICAALGLDIISRGGAYYSCDLLPDGRMKGKDEMIKFFIENDQQYKELAIRVDQCVIDQKVTAGQDINEVE